SNRPDMLSHEGVGREVCALFGLTFKPLDFELTESDEASDAAVGVEIRTELCPHFTARVLRGVKIGPSPDWLRARLEAVGQRAINNIVDVTNYVMLAIGQPSHAFDFAKVAGGKLIVRHAAEGEQLTTLDDHPRKLTPDMLVVADTQKASSLAGVMGGAESEVSDATDTVLLECARWDPLNIRTVARHFALHSEASYRFERGIPASWPKRGSDYNAALMQQLTGCTVTRGYAEAGSDAHEPPVVSMDLANVRRLLGIDVDGDEAAGVLAAFGLQPQRSGTTITCTAPPHRQDIRIEADLIEEVARGIGYDRIPTRDKIEIIAKPAAPERRTTDLIRRTLVAGGWFESVTFSFASDAVAADFLPPGATGLQQADPRVRKADNALRPSVIPGLLESVRRNEANGTPTARLYEIGSAFWYADAKPVERVRLALAGGDFAHLRGTIGTLLHTLDADRPLTVEPGQRAGFGKQACGVLHWGGAAIGHVGMCARGVAEKLGLREPVAIAELDLEPLIAGRVAEPALTPIPKLPAVRRDLSLLLGEEVAYADVDAAIRAADLPDLEAVEHVTTYRGKPLKHGQKSLTLQLVFRNPEKTLKGEDVDAAMAKAQSAAAEKVGAEVRA
ncbi:MAG: phenylalanine--tRNA ligase subunit beta, partial [Planctomycetota bacterium]